MDNRKRSSGKKQWKTYKNQDIKAFKIQVIDENGEALGVMMRSKALQVADQAGLDLVQISYDPVSKLCTAKLLDYGKFQYEKKKTENEKKKQNKNKGQKEIKIGFNIGDHDLVMKVEKGKEFLEKGHTLRVVVKLKGREKVYANIARTKMDFVEKELSEVAKSQGLKKEGFGFSTLFFPLRK